MGMAVVDGVAHAGVEDGNHMEILMFIGVVAAVGVWTYKHGKRLGSRLVYRIGRHHGRRRFGSHHTRRHR